MIRGKKRVPKIFHQVDIGAGFEADSIAERADNNPRKNFLATDFKFTSEKEYLERYKRYGVRPFPKNLFFLEGAALTAINRMAKAGKKTNQLVIAMGVDHLSYNAYLGRIAKHAKKVLTPGGSIYFVSTWESESFREHVVPLFEKEGYSFEELKPNPRRQARHSSKAAAYRERYGQIQNEYVFTLK